MNSVQESNETRLLRDQSTPEPRFSLKNIDYIDYIEKRKVAGAPAEEKAGFENNHQLTSHSTEPPCEPLHMVSEIRSKVNDRLSEAELEARTLSLKLKQAILEAKPNANVPASMKSWDADMKFLLKKRSSADISAAIDFAVASEWFVVMSSAALRKKIDNIEVHIQRAKRPMNRLASMGGGPAKLSVARRAWEAIMGRAYHSDQIYCADSAALDAINNAGGYRQVYECTHWDGRVNRREYEEAFAQFERDYTNPNAKRLGAKCFNIRGVEQRAITIAADWLKAEA